MRTARMRPYRDLLDAAVAAVGADAGSVQLVDEERPGELRLVGWRGFDPASAAFWEAVPAGSTSACGASLAAGERVIVPDVEEEATFAGSDDMREYRRSRLRAVQSTPLRGRDGRLVGMLSTLWRAPHTPPAEELHLIDRFAQTAGAQREASLHADLQQRLREATQRWRGVSAVSDAAASAQRARLLQAFIRQSRSDELPRRCAWCGRIELNDSWLVPETFLAQGLPERVRERSTHGICPGCLSHELDVSAHRHRS